MKSVCLVHCVNEKIANTQMFGIHYMPVWAYTLSTYLKEELSLEVSLFDTRICNNKLPEYADYYLFSGINQDQNDIVDLQKTIKAHYPTSKFVIGGPITWSYDLVDNLGVFENFDHIYIGDGESGVVHYMKSIISGDAKRIFKCSEKFDISKARLPDQKLLDKTIDSYYGGIIEVARGCPFLCEFCDIRIQLDNNRAHCKPVDLIIQELEYFATKDITQILFACDNFIGDPIWAEEVCDAIIKISQKLNKSFKIYTWLTINLANHDRLLDKMRIAGFDMLFIGIESFGTNQLLETAKIQNIKTTMTNSIKKIQSFGFVIVAGLIFGFDSDPDNVSEETLEGISNSGLITGDPSLLMALPGTPLYKRMKMSGRLRQSKLGLGGSKFSTNIMYLKPRSVMIQDVMFFISKFNSGKFQYLRLKNYYKNLKAENISKNSKSDESYINIFRFLYLISTKPSSLIAMLKRVILLMRPDRLYYVLKGFFLTIAQPSGSNLMQYYKLWGFMWSNSLLKYGNLKDSDFDIESVTSSFDIRKLIPSEYANIHDEPIPIAKIKAQRNLTIKALNKITHKRGHRGA